MDGAAWMAEEELQESLDAWTMQLARSDSLIEAQEASAAGFQPVSMLCTEPPISRSPSPPPASPFLLCGKPLVAFYENPNKAS